MKKSIVHLAGVAGLPLAIATPAGAVTGVAADGLKAMRELNAIVLGNLNNGGGEIEGKAYVGGDVGGNGFQVGFGNSRQGQASSSRTTLTVGGKLNANINLSNGSNGGNGNVSDQGFGAYIVGDAKSIDMQSIGGKVNIGGNLVDKVGLSKGAELNVAGNVSGQNGLDLRDDVTVRIGGNAAKLQGGNNTSVSVTGTLGQFSQGQNGVARVGGSVGQANLSNGSTLEVGGSIGQNSNLGNNNVVKALGSVSGNGSNGTTIYAGGAFNGNANGATIRQNYNYNAPSAVAAPTTPAAPVVAGLATQTDQLAADLNALSVKLGSLTSLGTISSTNNALDYSGATNGFAVFSMTAAAFQDQNANFDRLFANTPIGMTTIINVAGTSLNQGGNNNASARNQDVIWNFFEATSLTTKGFHGSILATNATLTNGSSVEGSIAVKNFQMNGEVHLGTFNGTSAFLMNGTPPAVGAVPEPAIWAQLILGFGVAGTALRRRRRIAAATV